MSAAAFGYLGDVSEKAIAPGKPMLAIILVQELSLQTGHVYIRRTFRFAGFAFQAEVEHVEKSGVGQPLQLRLTGHR